MVIGVWVGALVLVTGASRSAAQPPQDSEVARVHYEKATAAYALGNFTEAAVSYERAFELKPDPALLYNAAQAHRRGGNRPRAMELYRSLLQVFPRAENRDLAERHLRELERTDSAGPLPVSLAASPPASAPISAVLPSPMAGEVVSRGGPSAGERRAFWRRPWVWVAAGVATVVATGVTVKALSGKVEPRPSWGQVGP
jgi:tetratricopeptide (TPR) repeat protein